MTQDAVPENEELTEALMNPFYGVFCGAENGCISVSKTDKGIRKTEILISYASTKAAGSMRIHLPTACFP